MDSHHVAHRSRTPRVPPIRHSDERPPHRANNRLNNKARLAAESLENRENPAVPVGLTDVSILFPGGLLSSDYIENHSVTRNEANTVTLDQSGTGAAGTFNIDVANGTGSTQFSYHLTMSGQFANGVYTVTSETYNEIGSYSVALARGRVATASNHRNPVLRVWDVKAGKTIAEIKNATQGQFGPQPPNTCHCVWRVAQFPLHTRTKLDQRTQVRHAFAGFNGVGIGAEGPTDTDIDFHGVRFDGSEPDGPLVRSEELAPVNKIGQH